MSDLSPPSARNRLGKLLLVLLAVGALAAAVRLLLGDRLEPKAALAAVRSVQEHAWAYPAFFGAYVVLTTLFAPAVLFHMVAGAAWGFWKGLLLNLVCCNITANLHFYLARKMGRESAAALLARWKLSGFDAKLSEHGFRNFFAIRLLPLPFVGVNVAAACTGLRWRDFALGTLCGTLPVTAIYTYFASALVEGVAGAREEALKKTLLAAGALILIVVLPTVLRRLAARLQGASGVR